MEIKINLLFKIVLTVNYFLLLTGFVCVSRQQKPFSSIASELVARAEQELRLSTHPYT